MSTAAKIDTSTAPLSSDKVIPLQVFAGEEQVKNSDQGNIVVAKTRKRKHPLPASNQVNVPVLQTEFDKKLAQFAHNFNALSKEQKKALADKFQSAASTLVEHYSKLATAVKDNPTPPAPPKDHFDSWNQSILLAYTDFAKNQMDQNGLIMNGWQYHQEAENVTLQAAADAEQKTSKLPQTGAGVSTGAVIGIAIGVAVLLAVLTAGVLAVGAIGVAAVGTSIATAGVASTVGTVATVATGTAILGSWTAAGIGVAAGVLGGLATGLGCYFGAQKNAAGYNNNLINGNAGGNLLGGITEKGQPDSTLMAMISNLNTFWGMISNKTNNNIQSGTQTNLVQPSSNDTSLGQQASDAIRAMGQCLTTKAQ
jgi:hypothetical protein